MSPTKDISMMTRRPHLIWRTYQPQAALLIKLDKYGSNFPIYLIQFKAFQENDCNNERKKIFSFRFQNESDSDEEDPLDAYMMGIEKHLEKEKVKPDPKPGVQPKPKGTRGDIDDEDDEESYYR